MELHNFYVILNDINPERHIFTFNTGGLQTNYKDHTKTISHPAHPAHPAHTIDIDDHDNVKFFIVQIAYP